MYYTPYKKERGGGAMKIKHLLREGETPDDLVGEKICVKYREYLDGRQIWEFRKVRKDSQGYYVKYKGKRVPIVFVFPNKNGR